MQFSRGTQISIGLHIVLLLLVIFGLPAFFDMKRKTEEVVISVEILPVTGIDNIKPASHKPAPEVQQPKEQPKPVETPKEAKPDAPKPTPASSAALVPPTPAKEVVKEDAPKEKKPEEKPKDEPKPKPKVEKPKEKEKPKVDDLDAILKSVAKAAKTEEKQNPTKTPKPTEAAAPAQEPNDAHNNSKNYDASKPLSMSELSLINSQINKCWAVQAGAKDAHTLVVVLRIQLNQDGSLIGIPQLAENQNRYYSDTFFRAAADSAIRAVRRCTPIKGLPIDKYDTWKDFELNFDPKDALY